MRDTVLAWQLSLLDHQVSAVVGGSSSKKFSRSHVRLHNDPGVSKDAIIWHHLCKMDLFGMRIGVLA